MVPLFRGIKYYDNSLLIENQVKIIDVKELLVLLTKKQRKRLYILQFLVIIMSFTEILGPFMVIFWNLIIC